MYFIIRNRYFHVLGRVLRCGTREMFMWQGHVIKYNLWWPPITSLQFPFPLIQHFVVLICLNPTRHIPKHMLYASLSYHTCSVLYDDAKNDEWHRKHEEEGYRSARLKASSTFSFQRTSSQKGRRTLWHTIRVRCTLLAAIFFVFCVCAPLCSILQSHKVIANPSSAFFNNVACLYVTSSFLMKNKIYIGTYIRFCLLESWDIYFTLSEKTHPKLGRC